MSDAGSTAPSGKVLPWTDEAKYQLLLRIVGQLMRNGQSINWKEMNIPGRTPKSLQHQWGHIKTAVAEFEKYQGGASTPSQVSAKRPSDQKGARKRVADELATPETSPEKPKRQRKPLPKERNISSHADNSEDELTGGKA